MIVPLVIGSRGSDLALWQARHIASALLALGVPTRIDVIKTTGDHLQTASLVQAGGKGLFTKEIEEALLERRIDLAVHSLKDLPTDLPDNLLLAAVLEREDARDALVGGLLNDLPVHAVVGTSSERRAAQLRLLRPDLQIRPIRGNVDTRLRKWSEGQYDAIVLAAAGLRRLGFAGHVAQYFEPEQMCPAPGQGALAIETRLLDAAFHVCDQLTHPPTRAAVLAEREVLASLGGGCQLPVGAFAQADGTLLHLTAVVISPDGTRHLRESAEGVCEHPEELGARVAASLHQRGAAALLRAAGAEPQR